MARLALDDGEIEKFGRQFNGILRHIRKIDELDLSATEPVSHPFNITNVFREDKASLAPEAGSILEIAPSSARGMIRVPQIMEGKS